MLISEEYKYLMKNILYNERDTANLFDGRKLPEIGLGLQDITNLLNDIKK